MLFPLVKMEAEHGDVPIYLKYGNTSYFTKGRIPLCFHGRQTLSMESTLTGANSFFKGLTPIVNGGKNQNDRVDSLENVPMISRVDYMILRIHRLEGKQCRA